MVEDIFSLDPVSTVIVSPSRTVVTRFTGLSGQAQKYHLVKATISIVCFLQNVILATNALLSSELSSKAAMAGKNLPGSK